VPLVICWLQRLAHVISYRDNARDLSLIGMSGLHGFSR